MDFQERQRSVRVAAWHSRLLVEHRDPRRWWVTGVFAILLCWVPVAAHASEVTATPLGETMGITHPQGRRLSLVSDGFIRWNSKAAIVYVGAVERWGYSRNDRLLWRDLYAKVGMNFGLTPGSTTASVFFEAVPIAVLQLRAQYTLYRFFGTSTLPVFPSADSRFGDPELSAAPKLAGWGQKVFMSPTLRAKAGPVILRAETDLVHYRLASSPGFYWEGEHDLLLKESAWVIAESASLLLDLWQPSPEEMFVIGPHYMWSKAIGTDMSNLKVAGIASWIMQTNLLGMSRLHVLGLVGGVVKDRNRQGELFFVVGLGGEWDL